MYFFIILFILYLPVVYSQQQRAYAREKKIRKIGQPELRIELNEGKLARYRVSKKNVQSIIEMAIGGKSASMYEDEQKFNIMVRYKPQYR